MGVHQRIDRLALRSLHHLLPPHAVFPSQSQILHFEGLNGPDGIKRKSPAQDEPWHYINPDDADDLGLIGMINDHIHNLSAALSENNLVRAGFEAAWMAHAVTDGLTPAHHYPLEAKLEELRGEGLETRNSRRAKVLLPGPTRLTQIRNNWEYWGAKGIMTTHLAFELGVATTIAGRSFDDDITIGPAALDELNRLGFDGYFMSTLLNIDRLDMYEQFSRSGWTSRLARQTTQTLVPDIIRAVALGWFVSYQEASRRERP